MSHCDIRVLDRSGHSFSSTGLNEPVQLFLRNVLWKYVPEVAAKTLQIR